MSLEDYMTAVKPKIHGTRNLKDAFKSESLEFFIMLSSVTAILGKTGQANYSVGNDYQDGLSQSKPDSKCKYISLNLGAVDGSEAIMSLTLPQQEFMRLGSALMSFDEVFKAMEYAMSPQSTQDGLVQMVFGFDRKSMETVHDEFGLANPLFGQVPYLDEKEAVTEQATMDVETLLQQATSVDEIHLIIIRAICERFAIFTARPVEEIDPVGSLDEFGIDSLVAIELKNWLVRTFQVSVQTSEVFEAPSITSLGKLIAARSKITSKELTNEAHTVAVAEELIKTVPATENVASHSFACCRKAKELPKLPINNIDTIFQTFLDNARMFLSANEFENISRDVAEFKKPGGVGRVRFNRLYEEANNPEIENWQDKYFLQSMYLQCRYPLAPFGNFMGFHPQSKLRTPKHKELR